MVTRAMLAYSTALSSAAAAGDSAASSRAAAGAGAASTTASAVEHPAGESDPPAVRPGAPQFADGGAGLDGGAGGPAGVGDGERQPSHAAADAVEDGGAGLAVRRRPCCWTVAGGLDERAPA